MTSVDRSTLSTTPWERSSRILHRLVLYSRLWTQALTFSTIYFLWSSWNTIFKYNIWNNFSNIQYFRSTTHLLTTRLTLLPVKSRSWLELSRRSLVSLSLLLFFSCLKWSFTRISFFIWFKKDITNFFISSRRRFPICWSSCSIEERYLRCFEQPEDCGWDAHCYQEQGWGDWHWTQEMEHHSRLVFSDCSSITSSAHILSCYRVDYKQCFLSLSTIMKLF